MSPRSSDRLPSSRARARWPFVAAVAVAVLLHLTLVAGGLAMRARRQAMPTAGTPPVVDLIMRDPGEETKPAKPTPETAPKQEADAEKNTESDDGEIRAKAVAPARQPAPEAPEAADVRLGMAGETDEIIGDRVAPTPDAAAHNIPPRYPREAARLGEHGEVTLLLHVGASGAVVGVQVLSSSGVSSLDKAAYDAVRTWRFQPARQGDDAIDSTVSYSFEFVNRNGETR